MVKFSSLAETLGALCLGVTDLRYSRRDFVVVEPEFDVVASCTENRYWTARTYDSVVSAGHAPHAATVLAGSLD